MWLSVPRLTKAVTLWVVALLGSGTALFLWVDARQGAAVAFDVLTQHKSPIGSNLGTAGVLLSSFGYFVVPATIGALVAAAYIASGELSPRAIKRRVERLVKQYEAGKAAAPTTPAQADAATPGEKQIPRPTTGGSYVHRSGRKDK